MALSTAAEPKFPIGTKYRTRGKAPRICTVVDIHKTYNSQGELVRVRYVATHEFMGQPVTDSDVCETTILMSYVFPADVDYDNDRKG